MSASVKESARVKVSASANMKASASGSMSRSERVHEASVVVKV